MDQTQAREDRLEELMEIDEPTMAQFDEMSRLADELAVEEMAPRLTGPISVPGHGLFDAETGQRLPGGAA